MSTFNIVGHRIGEGSSVGTLQFVVTLAEAVGQTVTVQYRTLAGTAQNGVDYHDQEGTLTFAPFETSKTIEIRQAPWRSDGEFEIDRSVVVELYDPVVGRLPSGAASLKATGWIIDADTLGSNSRALHVSDPIVRERDVSTANAVFTVSLSQGFDEDTRLSYRTVNGSAVAGEDFVAQTGTIQFLAGQTEATVTVRVNGDNIAETAESFGLAVSPHAAIAGGKLSGAATILDDDTPSALPSISAVGEATGEGSGVGGTVNFHVFLNAPSTETVTVRYQTAAGTATAGVDFRAAAGTLTFAPGETSKTVKINQIAWRPDGVVELDESVVLELFDPLRAEFGGAQRVVRATSWILDGDNLGNARAVFVSSPVVTEPRAGEKAFAVFDVELSRPATERIVLNYETRSSGSANAATAGGDYKAKSGTVTFAPGQTKASVKIELLADQRLEAAEDFLLRIVPPLPPGHFINTAAGTIGTATIADSSITGTFEDNTLVGTSARDVMFGLGGNDSLFGLGGDDRLDGGSGDDQLYGGSGKDSLYGGVGRDTLDGGSGADRMEGGPGADTYVVDNTGDRVVETQGGGGDLVRASISYKLVANVENLTLTGSKRIDGTGNSLDNVIRGNTNANRLDGGAGADTLLGGAGNDRLIGGLGTDSLSGGGGADVFVFRSITESRPGSARDVIRDFQRGRDEIDLSAIDANTRRVGDQDFKFIGSKAFSDTPGELRFAGGVLRGDINGDGRTDFEVRLIGIERLGAGDFEL